MGQEIQHGQKRAEIIEEMNKSSALDTTGCAVTVGNGNYPVMENWQKALGGHVMWRSGSVQVSGDTFAMKIVIHEKGRYDFNKGMRDIATGIPDDVNDCFATLGWAKPCMTRGTVTRTVTWTRGDIAGSSVVSGGERG
ncbi:hypothetical protein [Actinacidiphila yeochonensis]|uniref:hypothetical protein n=1 Tax=Actinacidiphila yeochonensis TaxID=89050 RepID=UPI0012FF3BC6|nr:hypothetical protein [Actinacidiphila yeochonensis]